MSVTDGVEELFGYNRGNFMFDQVLRQWREYQEQDMRVKQFMLYREDVRDLTELTTSKMDSYLMIAVLELGCCLDLLVHGVLHIKAMKDEPTWLLWLYVISLAEAFVFLFLSAWLAIHASVSAHSFSVRLLTQFVRLPLPSRRQIDAGSALATDYENKGFEDLLRIPVLRAQAERLGGNASQRAASQDPSGTAVAGLVAMSQPGANAAVAAKHVRLYRDLQDNWQAHDAYARACLALGTYKLLHAVAYYTVGLLVLEMHAPWAGLACAIVLPMLAWLLIKLDLYFSNTRRVVGALLLMLGPLLALVAATLNSLSEPQRLTQFVLVSVIFAMHASLIVCVACVARAEHVSERGAALPTRFRSVLYLDVFGWLPSPHESAAHGARANPTRSNQVEREMPGSLREGLYKESSRLGRQLRCEFQTWEVASLEALPSMLRRLRSLQREFEGLCQDCNRLHQEDLNRERISDTAAQDVSWTRDEDNNEPAGVAELENNSIWLRLECYPERVSWFVQPHSGARLLQEPQGKFVSELDGVAARIEMLRQRLDSLKDDARLARRGRSRLSRFAGGLMPPDASATTSRGLHLDTGSATVAERTEAAGQARSASDAGGGAEAWISSEAAAQTFHPRRDRREESRQPAGQVPWHTFLIASSVLVAVWIVGIVWYVINPLAMSRKQNVQSQEAIMEAANGLRPLPYLIEASLLLPSQWPGPVPFQPLDLACDAHYGHVLVAEKFGVHEVPMDSSSGSELTPSASIETCLATHPRFRAGGLTGIGLECDGPRDCRATLLGAESSALVCPLGQNECPPTLVTPDTGGSRQRCSMPWSRALESAKSFFQVQKGGDHFKGFLSETSSKKQGRSLARRLSEWNVPDRKWTAACTVTKSVFSLRIPEVGEGSQGIRQLWKFHQPDEAVQGPSKS